MAQRIARTDENENVIAYTEFGLHDGVEGVAFVDDLEFETGFDARDAVFAQLDGEGFCVDCLTVRGAKFFVDAHGGLDDGFDFGVEGLFFAFSE